MAEARQASMSFAAVGLLIAMLAACGGGGDSAEQAPDGDDPRVQYAICMTAMVNTLVAAAEASKGAADPDAAYTEALGKIPSPCRLLDGELLKTLLAQAKAEADAVLSNREAGSR